MTKLYPSLFTPLLAMLLANPAVAASPCGSVVAPGETCSFEMADDYAPADSDSGAGHYNEAAGSNNILFATQVATLPLTRAEISTYQEDSFEIEGEFFDSVVPARITGHVEANGYFALVGMTQARFQVEAQIVDFGPIGAPIAQEKIVHAEGIFDKKELAELAPSFGAEASLEGGSASAIQGGGTFGLGTVIPLLVKSVDASTDFAFEVLLQRGHVYALRIETTVTSRVGMIGGWSQVTFARPGSLTSGESFPALLSPEVWLDPLLDAVIGSGTTSADVGIPDISVGDLGFGSTLFTLPALAFDMPLAGHIHISNSVDVPNPLAYLPSAHSLLDTVGVPTDLKQATDEFMPLLDFLKLPEPSDGGVIISALEIDIAEDVRETSARSDIERILARKSAPIASYQLPRQYGGQLETVAEIVAAAVNDLEAAGIPVSDRAKVELVAGDNFYAQSDWKAAFKAYQTAYRMALRI